MPTSHGGQLNLYLGTDLIIDWQSGTVAYAAAVKNVDTSGEIIDSGDQHDGEVANAIEMIAKIAESQRGEQVFVRHAFRFWMGRNETLNDAAALQAAHRAYRDNDGSMNSLVTPLLTSDAFLYRTRTESPDLD